MANAAAAKGKRFEYELREGLRGAGFDVEQPNRAGATNDEGDMVVRVDSTLASALPDPVRIVVEAKNEKSISLAGYIKEAMDEAAQYAEHRRVPRDRVQAVAIVKRRGLNWRKAYVVTTVEEYFGLTEG